LSASASVVAPVSAITAVAINHTICNNLPDEGTMSGLQVQQTRKRQGLTQQEAAHLWGVSQGYVSLMERGQRRVPERLARRLLRSDPNLVTALPLRVTSQAAQDLPKLVGSLGYPGFEYLAERRLASNPAAVVLAALKGPLVPARVTEALPWILRRFVDLDWSWLVNEAKLANVQNRLGFLVSLAEELATAKNDLTAARTLGAVRLRLEDARLVKEDTLGRTLTEPERQHFRQHRPEEAAHWNLLTGLRASDLRHVD
jgi:DNA-binding transcriptional regulator YiaG